MTPIYMRLSRAILWLSMACILFFHAVEKAAGQVWINTNVAGTMGPIPGVGTNALAPNAAVLYFPSTLKMTTNIYLHDDLTNALHTRLATITASVADVQANMVTNLEPYMLLAGGTNLWLADTNAGISYMANTNGNQINFEAGTFSGSWSIITNATVTNAVDQTARDSASNAQVAAEAAAATGTAAYALAVAAATTNDLGDYVPMVDPYGLWEFTDEGISFLAWNDGATIDFENHIFETPWTFYDGLTIRKGQTMTIGGESRTNYPQTNSLASTNFVTNALASYLQLAAGSNNPLVGNLYNTNAYISRRVNFADVSIGGYSLGARQSIDFSGLYSSITMTNARGGEQTIWGAGNSFTAIVQQAGIVQRLFVSGDNNSAVAAAQYGMQIGSLGGNSSAHNAGVASLQLFRLTNTQSSTIADGGDASILIGAGVASNKNTITVGDGQESHGDGSISAASFWENGTNILELAGVGSGFPLEADGDLAGYSLTNGFFVGDGSGLTGVVASVTNGVSSVNGLDGAVILDVGGINALATNENTLTITATEVDDVFTGWLATNDTWAGSFSGDGSGLTNLTGLGSTVTNIGFGLTGNGDATALAVDTTKIVTNNQSYVHFGQQLVGGLTATTARVTGDLTVDDIFCTGNFYVTSNLYVTTTWNSNTVINLGTNYYTNDLTIYSSNVQYLTTTYVTQTINYVTNYVDQYVNAGGSFAMGEGSTFNASNAAAVYLPGYVWTGAAVRATGAWNFAEATVTGVLTNETEPAFTNWLATNIVDGYETALPAVWVDGAALLFPESNRLWRLNCTGANNMTNATPLVISTNGLTTNQLAIIGVRVARSDTNTFSWGSVVTNNLPSVTQPATNLYVLFWNGAAWVAY